eukprot:Hpha_TRINITY_DN1354_c0_g1::TRINITY_DN1354_c0_g1_i1::g.93315::m.93315
MSGAFVIPPMPASLRAFRIDGVVLTGTEKRDGVTWHICEVEAFDAAPGVLGSRGVHVRTIWTCLRRFSQFEALFRRIYDAGVNTAVRFPSKRDSSDARAKGLEAWVNSALAVAREASGPEILRLFLADFFDSVDHQPRAAGQDRLEHFRLCALDLLGDELRRATARAKFSAWRRRATHRQRARDGMRLLCQATDCRLRSLAWRRLQGHVVAQQLRRMRELLAASAPPLKSLLLGREASPAPPPSSPPPRWGSPGGSLSVGVVNTTFRVTGAIIGGAVVARDGATYRIEVEALDPAPSLAHSIGIPTKWRVRRNWHSFQDLNSRIGSGLSGVKFPSQQSQSKLTTAKVEAFSRDLEAWLNSAIQVARGGQCSSKIRDALTAFFDLTSHPSKHHSPEQLWSSRTRLILKGTEKTVRQMCWGQWRRWSAGARARRFVEGIANSVDISARILGDSMAEEAKGWGEAVFIPVRSVSV